MPDFLSIEITGADALRAELANALNQLQNPCELMVHLGALLEANIQQRFERRRDPDDQRWDTLADSTKAGYARQDKGARRGSLLQRTGQMRNSLAANAGADYVEVGMHRVTTGGAWSIPLLHETGTTRMPRRGIFLADPTAGTLGKGDEADLQVELVAFMDGLFGG